MIKYDGIMDNFSCLICKHSYFKVSMTVLPCQHSVCLNCAGRLSKKVNVFLPDESSIKCPLCKITHKKFNTKKLYIFDDFIEAVKNY